MEGTFAWLDQFVESGGDTTSTHTGSFYQEEDQFFGEEVDIIAKAKAFIKKIIAKIREIINRVKLKFGEAVLAEKLRKARASTLKDMKVNKKLPDLVIKYIAEITAACNKYNVSCAKVLNEVRTSGELTEEKLDSACKAIDDATETYEKAFESIDTKYNRFMNTLHVNDVAATEGILNEYQVVASRAIANYENAAETTINKIQEIERNISEDSTMWRFQQHFINSCYRMQAAYASRVSNQMRWLYTGF